jgi:signal transduction histidine kinase
LPPRVAPGPRSRPRGGRAMTLRAKVLGLFTLLAVGPLLGIGVVGYVLSERAVAAQLETQTRVLAERSAEEIARRMRVIDSDLRLLGGNAESERLLRLRAGGGVASAESREAASALSEAERFFDAAWSVVGGSYATIELRDADGATLLRRGGDMPREPVGGTLLPHSVAVTSWDEPERRIGTMHALVHLDAVLPAQLLDARFGGGGISAVVHRPTGRVLHFAGGEVRPVHRLEDAGIGAAALQDGEVREVSGAVRLEAPAGTRIGWLAMLDEAPLTVISLADREEFAAPFDRQRTAQFGLVLLLAAAVLPVGWVLLRRMTRSLDELTAAADRVGSGDFAPELPAAGRDEVGRLTDAFGTMTQEIRRMVLEIERSRQLAAIGEFAAELAHEIRNPLTALKLNLQRLERMLRRSDVASEAERPLQIALSEVARLDRVVSTTLRLGRPDMASERQPVALATLIEAAVAPLREQLDEQGIALELSCHEVAVVADAGHMTGALLNVLLNAVEAMPAGGTLDVHTTLSADGGSVELRIADSGGGIPAAALERLFRPFSTTKPNGTGLGLALAHRTLEAHGGTLELEETGPAGTRFRIRLPTASEPVPA